jgi:hypothetical protein
MTQRISRLLLLAGLLLSGWTAVPANAQTFVFHMRGDQEVPPVSTAARGGCIGVLNQGAATFDVTCVHNVASANIMHIHAGAPGVNGPILFDMGDPTSPVTTTWTGMSGANISDMLAGNLYVNIHSPGRPAGEIRGQILSRTVDTVAFTMSGAQVVPASGSAATANCSADLDSAATALDISCTHNVPSPASAHLHRAPSASTGPIVFTFPSPASPLNANVPLAAVDVASFAATFLYLDVHGASSANDIRGQIGDGQQSQTITFDELDDQTTSASDFTVSATATSSLTVTFSSLTTSVCTVSGTTVDIVGRGICTIAADQAGDFTYFPAPQVTQSFVVSAVTDDIFVFHFSSDQVAPPASSPARGGCKAGFDAGSSTLTMACVHNVIGATSIHVHRGAVGVTNSTIVFNLGTASTAAFANWTGMTPAEIADLFAGNFYVDIHSSLLPSGEIRGQLLTRTVDTVNFTMTGSQVVPATVTPVTGNCTADLDNPGVALAISCTHNLPIPDEAHLHRARARVNGPNVFTFPSAASPFAGNPTLNFIDVASFAATFLYVDLHSTDSTQDIRGQIGTLPSLVAQTITFGSLADKRLTDPAFDVSAAASSGLTVAFSSLTTSVCTVSTSTVTLVAAGPCQIAANQAGDNVDYEPAPQVTQTFTVVSCSAVNATPSALGYATFGMSFSQTFTMTSGSAPASFSMLGTLPAGMSFSTNALSGTPGQRGAFPVTLRVTDNLGCVANVGYTILVRRNRLFAVGAGWGGSPIANTYSGIAATLRTSGVAYTSDHTGGVSVAMGDTNGDGVAELVTGAAAGGAPHVKVYSGSDSSLLLSFFAYDAAVTSGVEVATGDFNADGFSDIVTVAGPGGPPLVRVFDGRSGNVIATLTASAAGLHVAAGDVNGDGIADFIFGAGPGGPAVVQIVNGATGATIRQFEPYAATYQSGVYVAAGDFNGDRRADVVTGASTGSGHVRIFDGVTGNQLTTTAIDNFFPFPGSYGGGVRVAAGDLNGDDIADLIVAPGVGFVGVSSLPTIKIYDGATGTQSTSFVPFTQPVLGAYVAAPPPQNRMFVDLPQANATVTSPVRLAGWIVEEQAATGVGADVVHVWAFPTSGGAAQFVGVGNVNVNRGDIASYFGGDFYRSGFDFTATIAPGTYDLVFYVHNATTGIFDQWRIVRITVN